MTQLNQLLLALGLERFAEVFAREDVDIEAAGLLGEADLERLGIPLGPRRKLLRAFARLPAQAPETPATPSAAPAERRQLTVLFCDMVGSTALSGAMDPEALRALMGRYYETCRAVVETYAGHVAQYQGDGVVAYFGWPIAHEDDAERALRAGLELVTAVKEVGGTARRLQVRVGIATGPVVVGEGAWQGENYRLAVGETPNVAARLQELARGDDVVVGTTTRRLAGGVFAYEELGSHVLKGIVGPVQAWKVSGLKQTEGRFEASRGAEPRLSTFVGRAQEVDLLGAKWAQACGGRGQVVLLEGEPGIGKSRITQWLLTHIGGEKHYRLRYQCSPYHAQSAFHPIIEQVERAARFGPEDGAEARLDKLEALLNHPRPQTPRTLALFASLLGLGGWERRYGALNLTPQKQKELTLQALSTQARELSGDAPVVVVLEDAHWIDPSTLESLGQTVDAVSGARVLVVITYRPEFKAAWTSQGHVTHVVLSRLQPEQTRSLAGHVAGDHPLPAEIVEQITEKTDGIPLFVEELTKAVLEAGLLALDPGSGGYRLNGPLSPIAIPATLRDSLTARLDRLSPTKDVAQIGACIGRDFGYGLLERVAGLTRAQLDDALDRLAESGLVFQRGRPPEATYTFKHALIQDAAYDGLLRSRRTQIHARIAQALEQDFPDLAQAQPEIVAHHWTEAQHPVRATPLWIVAGQQALNRFALDEAIHHSRAGTVVARKGRDAGVSAMVEAEATSLLGAALTARYGWAFDQVYVTFLDALDLMGSEAPAAMLLPVLFGLWLNVLTQGKPEESLLWVRRMFEAAEAHHDTDLEVLAHSAAQVSHFWAGSLADSGTHGEAVLAMFDAERYARLAAITHHNPRTTAGVYLGQALWIRGHPDRALAHYRATVEFSGKSSHPFDTCFARILGGYVIGYRREPEDIFAATAHAYRISREIGIPFMEHVVTPPLEAFGLFENGEYERACRMIESAVGHWRAVGGRTNIPNWCSVWALALARLGRLDEADRVLGDAVELITTPGWGEKAHFAEVLRVQGEIRVLRGHPELAEEAFRKALAHARNQGAKSWELRTATSLARLMKSRGQREDAIALLRPVFDWFTEGRDTKDHREARALLDELAD